MRRKEIVVNMGDFQKLGLAVERSLPKLPPDVRQKVSAMLTPKAIATLAVIATVGVGSQWIGIGEVVDVVLIGYGVWTLGPEVKDVRRDLHQFFSIAIHAQTDGDLDRAADHFARVIAVIGVDGLAAILMHKAFKAVREFASGGGGGAPRSQGATQTRPSYIADEDAAQTLANRVRATPGFTDAVDDLKRGRLKFQGAKFALERITEEVASGKVALVEDWLPDGQAADMVRTNGDVVQFKSEQTWSAVRKRILGSGFSTDNLGEIPETRGAGEHEPGGGQSYKDAYRYARNNWQSGEGDVPLSGKFEYQIDGDRLLDNGATKEELQQSGKELEDDLNEAYSQDFQSPGRASKTTKYTVRIVYRGQP
ncbi:MAG: hypothetical protein WA324_09580 [Bryobacteraceae bacterium]